MSKKTYTAQDITAVMDKGMTDFQIKNFVIGAQMTPLKQLHQAAIEIEARENNLTQSEFEEKKNNLKIKILNEKLKRTEDELGRAEIELEILVIENKLEAILRERNRMHYELKSFYEVVDFFNENYDIDEMLSMKDTLDIDYWVKRLSKQAGLDLISTGRISNGNLSAMMDMPDEIFEVCLKETYKLATTLSKSVPMPAITAPGEEFLIKFGPNDGVDQNAIAQETNK
jgi:hypothetical protein